MRQGRRHLHQRRQPDQPVADAVWCNADAMQVGIFGDPLQFGQPTHIERVGADDVDRLLRQQFDKVLAQVDLFAGVDRGGGAARHGPVEVGAHIGAVVAGDHILQPHQVVGFDRLGKTQRIRREKAGAAIKRQPHFIAQHLFHGGDTGDQMLEAPFGERAAVTQVALRLGFAIEKVGDRTGHGAVKGDRLFDDTKALWQRLDFGDMVGARLGRLVGHGEVNGGVVDADLVAHLAAQQFVDGQPSGLTGNVPERHFNRTDRTAPRLERAHAPNLHHHPLHVGRVFAQDQVTVKQHMGLEIGLKALCLAIALQPGISGDAHHRRIAQDCTFEIDDSHDGSFGGSWLLSSYGLW